MRFNKIQVVVCLMLGFPAASLSAPFNPDDLFKVDKPKANAAGSFARTAAQIDDANKAAEARKYLELANSKIAQQPNNDSYYFARAQIYRDMHEYRSSLADLDHAIKLSSANQSYYAYRAGVWGLLKDFSASLRDIDKAIAIGPVSAQLYRRRAGALHLLRQYDASLIASNRSVSLDPKSSETYVIRGTTKFYLKDYRGAELDCKKAESLEPGNSSSTKELRELLATVRL